MLKSTVPPFDVNEFANTTFAPDILPVTVSTLVDLLKVKLAFAPADPASLNITYVLEPATGPVAPVLPL